jgi:prolyl-tRNA synthetase
MRWSATLIPTLKDAPAEAVALSHRLLVRAGMVRQVGSGSFAYLPLGTRALNKVIAIVRQEMDHSGAVEVLMPALWPIEVLQESGRLGALGDDLVRFVDRHGRPHALAPTHEEVVTRLVGDEVKSYRQLPVTLYQVQAKFRDEARPRLGLLRTREFIMADAYSFAMDEADLEQCYQAMHEAYRRILDRCGLEYVVAEAETGPMGGLAAHEFMVPSPAGGDSFVQCPACGYAASVDRAEAAVLREGPPPAAEPELRLVDTPGKTTIEAVGRFLNVAPEQMIKTLIYGADGRPVAVLVRGDHEVNEAKLRRALGAGSLGLADARVIEQVTGAPVGFAGPVGLSGVEIVSDHAVSTIRDGVTGANKADAHLVGVVPGRDFDPGRFADLRFVTAGDRCPRCPASLGILSGIEVGHLCKLGTKYSKAMGAAFLGPDGRQQFYQTGCYGIGVSRVLAALVETSADGKGIVWVPGVAPYDVLVMPLDMSESKITDAAESAYRVLREAGVDVLLDDRHERPGVKFNDADLIGLPLRVVVGKSYLRSGTLEVQVRRDGARSDVEPATIASTVKRKLAELTPAMGARPPER